MKNLLIILVSLWAFSGFSQSKKELNQSITELRAELADLKTQVAVLKVEVDNLKSNYYHQKQTTSEYKAPPAQETPPLKAPEFKSPQTPEEKKVAPTTNETKSGDREIHTGPRGGKYYINGSGRKVYIKR